MDLKQLFNPTTLFLALATSGLFLAGCPDAGGEGDECDDDADCNEGLACYGLFCVDACNSNNDCDADNDESCVTRAGADGDNDLRVCISDCTEASEPDGFCVDILDDMDARCNVELKECEPGTADTEPGDDEDCTQDTEPDGFCVDLLGEGATCNVDLKQCEAGS